MDTRIAMPEEDGTQNIRYETLDPIGRENLREKMDEIDPSRLTAVNLTAERRTELRVMLQLVIQGIRTLYKDASKPNAIKRAETVIDLLKLLEPGPLLNSTTENPNDTIQNQNILKKIQKELGLLQEESMFKELSKKLFQGEK